MHGLTAPHHAGVGPGPKAIHYCLYGRLHFLSQNSPGWIFSVCEGPRTAQTTVGGEKKYEE